MPETSTPIPTSTGPHHYKPGAETVHDPVYPQLGNGGYEVDHYAIRIGYNPTTKALTGDDVITATARRTCPGSAWICAA